MVRSFFSRRKTIQEILNSGQEIRKNLEWVLRHQIPIKVSAESSPNRFNARMVEVDHSPLNAFILLQAESLGDALPVLNGKVSLFLEYESRRGIRFFFQSFLLSDLDNDSGEFRVGYPPVIETEQDIHAYRLQNISTDPIQVDVESHRGVIVNIGLHGLMFTCNQILETGKVIQDLHIELPEHGLVRGSAVVRHVQVSKEYPSWRYLCGVKITGMKPRDQKRLGRYLTRMLSKEKSIS